MPSPQGGGRSLYWVAFSSRRGGDHTTPQIYVSAVLVDESQNPPLIETWAPLRVDGQSPLTSNFAPDWRATHP